MALTVGMAFHHSYLHGHNATQPRVMGPTYSILVVRPRTPSSAKLMVSPCSDLGPLVHQFTLQPMEVYIDDEAKLTLHGLRQHYVKLKDSEKNRKLFELLDVLEFNQVT